MERIAELAERALQMDDLRDATGLLIQIQTAARLQAVNLRRQHFLAMPAASEALQ